MYYSHGPTNIYWSQHSLKMKQQYYCNGSSTNILLKYVVKAVFDKPDKMDFPAFISYILLKTSLTN